MSTVLHASLTRATLVAHVCPLRHPQTQLTYPQHSQRLAPVAVARWMEGAVAPQNSSLAQSEHADLANVHINSQFGSGNIEVESITRKSESGRVIANLRICPDPFCDSDKRAHFMWYYYRVAGVQGRELRMNIVNAGEASYPSAWQDYQSMASYDRKYWFRVPTVWNKDTGTLTIRHKPAKAACFYAYFAPYHYEMHVDLIAELQTHPEVKLHTLGMTTDGHDMDLLQIGQPGEGKPKIWVIARQHPGESMAEWFCEGFLRRLLDPHDAIARRARASACFFVVPNMNPDGSWRGHLRTNATGANLNREWLEPSKERSPEVLAVRSFMDAQGVDFMADCHGDEELPYNFVNGTEGIPSWDDRLERLSAAFKEAWLRCSPDFQTKYSYGRTPKGRANLRLAGSHVAERFKCLAFTIEMPFKDTVDFPEPMQGWSPERCLKFGASLLQPVMEIAPSLRKEV